MRFIRRVMLLSSAVTVLSGCGEGRRAEVEPQQQGPPDRPPVVARSGDAYPHPASTGKFGSYVWFGSYEGSLVHFRFSSASVQAAGARVMAVATLEDSSVLYLLVSSTDAAGTFRLDRFHDAGVDGIPDQSTRETLLTSGAITRFVTSIYARSRSAVYLYDQATGDILLAQGGAGGWISSIQQAPFASVATYPLLEHVRHIDGGADPGLGFALLASTGVDLAHASASSELPLLIFADANDDGMADGLVEHSSDRQPSVSDPRPFAGQSVLRVSRIGATADRTVEVWEIDPVTHSDIALLGSGVVGMAEGIGDIGVSPALVAGDVIAVRYQGSSSGSQRHYRVADAWPQVLAVSPDLVAEDTAVSVTLTGVNFTSSMLLRLVVEDAAPQSLSYQFIDSTSITATLPGITGPKVVHIYALGATQGELDPGPVRVARVCVIH